MVLWHILGSASFAFLRRRCRGESAVRLCEAAVAEELEETGCAGGIEVCGSDAGL